MEVAELYLALTGPNGRINGEVQAEDYVDQIDILDWSWGAALSTEQSDASASGGSSSSNRAEPKSVTVKKRFDRSSTMLMSGAANLSKFPKAVLTLLHRAEHGMKLTATLEGVRIEKYKLEVKDEEKEVTMEEEIVFSFEVIRIEYVGRPTAKGAAPARSFELRSLT